jgi:hypothetical protein
MWKIDKSALSAFIVGKKVYREVVLWAGRERRLPYQFAEPSPADVVDRILGIAIPGKIEY